MGLTRRHFLSGATVLGAAVVTGCTTTLRGEALADPDALREIAARPEVPDTVNITLLVYEPYSKKDGNDLTGPVPEVARKILTDLGVSEIKFTVVKDEQVVIPMVAAGRVELVAGLSVRPDLCGGPVRFSVPDSVSGLAFAVPKGNPKGINTFADVVSKGAKVAVWSGPSLPWENDAIAAGVPRENLVARQSPVEPVTAVRNGEADCFLFDDLAMESFLGNEDGLEKTTPFLPQGRLPLVGAYLFPEDSVLLEPFNAALTELHQSGEWLELAKPFGFTEVNEPPADLTTDKACAG
ncbi:transporter substrate-binding domain-containing protein [Actinophytocola oryzae]|uniref:transporter substrate-binding domain-containing protein n=1 Tax=Actinophytocola oryzae TaxID=502181 RepID=UPI001414D2EF|nr:transporter substrate-binding domain-containing protein [Actinophytocola oryzae]